MFIDLTTMKKPLYLVIDDERKWRVSIRHPKQQIPPSFFGEMMNDLFLIMSRNFEFLHTYLFLFAIQCRIYSFYSNENNKGSSSKINNVSPCRNNFSRYLTIIPKAPRSTIPDVSLIEETKRKIKVNKRKSKLYSSLLYNI